MFDTKYYEGILKEGYFNEKGYLRKDLITDIAEKIGENFVQKRLSKSQLRNFFNEVKAIDAKIDDNNNFEENLPFILMIKAKASYAYKKGGKNSKIPKNFYEFLKSNIELIEKKSDYKTFEGFVNFFEAVVAYFYGHGGENNQ